MSKNPYSRYTPEFKEKALALVAAGQPVAAVAQDLCVSSNLIYEWRSKAQGSQGGSAGLRAAGLRAGGEQSAADALRALRRENTRLQVENDILKKAAIILGSKPRASSAP